MRAPGAPRRSLGESTLMGTHHVFSGWFSKSDLADRVLEDGQLLAWTAWLAILAVGHLAEFDVFAVGVLVDINVGDTHCDCWNVGMA